MEVVSAQVVSCCVYDMPTKIMQHMHGNIPQMLDCWADAVVVHLLLLKSCTDWTFESSKGETKRAGKNQNKNVAPTYSPVW